MNSNASKTKTRFKAVAFDLDGTLTILGTNEVPASLKKKLAAIPLDVQLTVCTGRPLAHIHKVLDPIIAAAPNPEEQRKRWHIICDNGGGGYFWNGRKYQPFFEIPWPSEVLTREALAKLMEKVSPPFLAKAAIGERTVVTRYPRIRRVIFLVSRFSAYTHKRLIAALEKRGLLHHFKVQDSGIGNLVISAESGKGQAIARWMHYLGLKSEEILCIGDRPGPTGNDQDFLNGAFGVPYTVGDPGLAATTVVDEKGQAIHNSAGTEYLLETFWP